jgi:predicted ATPase
MGSIDRIEIQGFKSIRDLDLELRPLNVLIGANGAGKSNFISAFKLLNQIIERNLQLYVGKSGGADTLLHFGRKVTQEIAIRLHVGAYGYYARLVPSSGDSLIFADEQYWHPDMLHQPKLFHLDSGHSETQFGRRLADPTVRIPDETFQTLKNGRVYHFQDTSDSAKIKLTGDLDDNAFLRTDGANLAAFLYRLQQTRPDDYYRIVDTIRLVAPFFDDFMLRPSPLNVSKIQLEWREKGSDSYFKADRFSDGTLRFICLTTLLLQPNLPSPILIDEPELGLHPYAISLLASLLQSASTRTQIIITTQSVPLVDHFAPEDIIVVERHNGPSSFKRLSTPEIIDWLEDYSLGELWEKNIIGGRPR